jgi:hypothetical protein
MTGRIITSREFLNYFKEAFFFGKSPSSAEGTAGTNADHIVNSIAVGVTGSPESMALLAMLRNYVILEKGDSSDSITLGINSCTAVTVNHDLDKVLDKRKGSDGMFLAGSKAGVTSDISSTCESLGKNLR